MNGGREDIVGTVVLCSSVGTVDRDSRADRPCDSPTITRSKNPTTELTVYIYIYIDNVKKKGHIR
jgi:hypothetical protein